MQDRQREETLLAMLERNLRTVAEVVGPSSTILVCPDRFWLERFSTLEGFLSSSGSLNGDLQQARSAIAPTAQRLAVLLPDLPHLGPADVEAMIEASSEAEVVLCPDHKLEGTNGVVLRPAFALDFLFEGESFQRYQSSARERERTVVVLRRPGLALDADEVEDLSRMSSL